MEEIEGDRVDEIDKITEKFGSAKAATDMLVETFAQMIFEHGHIHCDAHPGNILIRRNPKDQSKP
jgi:aarF domain-containing kinase